MERTRAGAVRVTEVWSMGAGGIPEVGVPKSGVPKSGELVAGLAAVGMVIHDRSWKTVWEKFVDWGGLVWLETDPTIGAVKLRRSWGTRLREHL
jgi:hypothetical protein